VSFSCILRGTHHQPDDQEKTLHEVKAVRFG
jgi:hypothetical protein